MQITQSTYHPFRTDFERDLDNSAGDSATIAYKHAAFCHAISYGRPLRSMPLNTPKLHDLPTTFHGWNSSAGSSATSRSSNQKSPTTKRLLACWTRRGCRHSGRLFEKNPREQAYDTVLIYDTVLMRRCSLCAAEEAQKYYGSRLDTLCYGHED